MENQITALSVSIGSIIYLIVSINSPLWKRMAKRTKMIQIISLLITAILAIDFGFFNYVMPAVASEQLQKIANIALIPSVIIWISATARWLYLEDKMQKLKAGRMDKSDIVKD